MITEQDKRLLRRCLKERRQSQDPVRQVAAVIATSNGEVIAVGANRAQQQLHFDPDELQRRLGSTPNARYFLLQHAERAAIASAVAQGREIRGATMYALLYPCADCAQAIVDSGIVRLVVPQPADIPANAKWAEHFAFATEILQRAHVTIDTFLLDEALEGEAERHS